jgi:hypothetical protein
MHGMDNSDKCFMTCYLLLGQRDLNVYLLRLKMEDWAIKSKSDPGRVLGRTRWRLHLLEVFLVGEFGLKNHMCEIHNCKQI